MPAVHPIPLDQPRAARMRFLPARVHGVIDYLWGLGLLASPWAFGFADGGAPQWVAVVFGVGTSPTAP